MTRLSLLIQSGTSFKGMVFACIQVQHIRSCQKADNRSACHQQDYPEAGQGKPRLFRDVFQYIYTRKESMMALMGLHNIAIDAYLP